MPSLQYELDRLREADAHLARALVDIAEMGQLMAQQQEAGFDISVAEEIRAGRLPGR